MTTARAPRRPLAPVTESSSLHEKVAANVRAEIARNGMTQGQVAPYLRVSAPGVSERMRGITAFSLNEIEVLAVVFRMLPEDLLVGRPGPGGGPDFEAAAGMVHRQGLEPRTR